MLEQKNVQTRVRLATVNKGSKPSLVAESRPTQREGCKRPLWAQSGYVIAGKLVGSHVTDLQHPWRRIRIRAGLPGVRIHDLRHTYASNAVSGGMPIQMVGKLLGHSQIQTTMRYAHLADDPVNRAAEENATRLSEALSIGRSDRPR